MSRCACGRSGRKPGLKNGVCPDDLFCPWRKAAKLAESLVLSPQTTWTYSRRSSCTDGEEWVTPSRSSGSVGDQPSRLSSGHMVLPQKHVSVHPQEALASSRQSVAEASVTRPAAMPACACRATGVRMWLVFQGSAPEPLRPSSLPRSSNSLLSRPVSSLVEKCRGATRRKLTLASSSSSPQSSRSRRKQEHSPASRKAIVRRLAWHHRAEQLPVDRSRPRAGHKLSEIGGMPKWASKTRESGRKGSSAAHESKRGPGRPDP
mmetsp:Transcript_103576/g.309437  ORF Transcript_103576/g.309437 Transcript_103576/m.309437 type:complete len:262 (+) Transcript_103576:502-1287(+)